MSQVNPSVAKSLQTGVRFLRWMGVIVLAAILCSGITFVQPDEVAFILRFGKIVGDTPAEQIHEPGLLLAFPYLIDQVVKVPVRRIQEVEIDSLSVLERGEEFLESGYVLTGDQNIVLINAQVKYQVTDPLQYAFQVESPELTIKEIGTSALTKVLANVPVDRILAEGKKEVADQVIHEMQERASEINLGVNLIAIEFDSVNPPEEVKYDFDQVTSSYVEKQTLVQEALRLKEERIPNATAERDAVIHKAESYRADRIARAKAEVAEFNGLVGEYKRNPEVVKERIYRERVERIIARTWDQILLPENHESGKIILPYLRYRKDD